MRKTIIIIMLSLVMVTGSVVGSEMRAEAAATTTVTAIGIGKAILVLLAIAGVGITAGEIFDNGELGEDVVANFATWLQNHDPDTYLKMMMVATAIAAGRVINTLDAIFYTNLKERVREYFGTDITQSTAVGAMSKAISEISFVPNGTQTITISGSGTYGTYAQNYSVIGFSFEYGANTAVFFLPVSKSNVAWNGPFGVLFPQGTTIENLELYGYINWTRYWVITGSNITFYNTHLSANGYNGVRALIQSTINDFYAGNITTVTEDILMRPFQTVGDVSATSADSSVVAPGQTVTEDDSGEIVIDGDTTLNLSNVNIDEWLKSLAEGTTTYAQAMQAIGLAAVNTQEQTLEQVQAIVQALNPAAAETKYITGNYTVNLTDLFPFCIPFDLYKIVKCFEAAPVAPSATITFPVGYDGNNFTWEEYTVSLDDFSQVATVVRVFEYVLFVIGLMLITRKLIEG